MGLFNLKAVDAFGKILSTGTFTVFKSRILPVAESPHSEDPGSLTGTLQD